MRIALGVVVCGWVHTVHHFCPRALRLDPHFFFWLVGVRAAESLYTPQRVENGASRVLLSRVVILLVRNSSSEASTLNSQDLRQAYA